MSATDDWRQKMPGAFHPPLSVRLGRWALWLGFAGLFGWCLYDFGFTPSGGGTR